MIIQKLVLSVFVLLLFTTASAWANNVTVSGAFDGSEPSMAANPDSCNDAAKRYRVAGTINVSATGDYTVVDAGNWFPYYLTQGGIADTVIIIYAGSFNSSSPSTNRVASVDEFASVQLNAGTSYVLVVQHWCDEIDGAYAIVIDGGQATVSGDGFTSLPQTFANLNSGSPTAFFDDLGGNRRYKSEVKTVSKSGVYYFVDVGEELGGSAMSLRVYRNTFDPLNTDTNLVFNSEGFFIGSFSLQTGTSYVFVLVENAADSQRLQYVLYPPGPFNFNPGLNGAWVADGVEYQGILMEVLPSAGILFFAHFTFTDQVAVATKNTSRLTTQTSDGGGEVTNSLGADDQIWLTAFGTIPANGNDMTIKYENSTGGRFNSETPDATIDSNYGTGWIEGFTCDHLLINWNLPGGIVDTRDYYKATQDAVPYCESLILAGPVSPNW